MVSTVDLIIGQIIFIYVRMRLVVNIIKYW